MAPRGSAAGSPGVSSHEDSFLQRLESEVDAPQVELVGAGADHVLFSVRGLTPDGYLTDPDPLEAEVKRAMIRRARSAVLLVDGPARPRPRCARSSARASTCARCDPLKSP